MYSEIALKEFDWYLRDFFFRTGKNNKDKTIITIKIDKVAESLKNYLRYRDTDILEINNLLDIVLKKMHGDNIIKINGEYIEIKTRAERKQCGLCLYINYLYENEIKNCKRCKSFDLQEFPKKRGK
jgi:hypothetical protein